MTKLNIHRQAQVNRDDLFLQDIIAGWSAEGQKTLPCKYFYDELGSQLFDKICQTPEYYHTRTELAILDSALPEVAQRIGAHADILEFGSGAGIKIRKLIDALTTPRTYIPIDISEEILLASSAQLNQQYPDLAVFPVVADYLSPIQLPEQFSHQSEHKKLVFFPGSTISNFEPKAAIHFMKHIRSLLAVGDALLIGVDLVKPAGRILAAYNDAQGVTAAFNMNLLNRIQSSYQTDLKLENFYHQAIYNVERSRIEMHLISKLQQEVNIEGQRFSFAEQESIHTENSYKYSIESFQLLARNAGFDCTACYIDEDKLFSVHYLTAS
ncbi:L-histidine N(alpha)-methyltransferase [Reinekea sp.]|jgi:dimethylhistidine N-methyltransferase|uniref:L-histidine N(alpha)-methyltransferase n=1 Tax=Reinekea sp. TaxID=1970455 RepID=UPI002A833E45|nr:L-histidine N(alpha)-methyltransferase [Reinekea sp.]